MTVKEIEGRCWFPRIGLLLLSYKVSYGKITPPPRVLPSPSAVHLAPAAAIFR
jgi:hypothetical protein